MDVDEAHKVLGLYVGASHEQIELKYAELSQRLSSDEKTELDRLQLARRVALGEDAPTPETPLWRRGPVVVLMIFVALGLVSVAFFVAAKSLDKTQAERVATASEAEAVTARDAWASYQKATGITSEQAGKGDELFVQAKAAFDNGEYADAKQLFGDATGAWFAAFKAEDKRISEAWDTEVLGFWRSNLKNKFPFDADAEEEAEADDVARLLNPASGTIWAVSLEYEALSEVEVQDRKVVTPLKQYEQVKAQATPIRDALFGINSPTIDVQFEMRLKGPPSLTLHRLQVGDAEAVSRGDEFVAAHWRQSDGGATLTRGTDRSEKREVLVDLSDSDWGLLRMLSKGNYLGERDGMHAWEFEPEQFGARRGKGAAIHVKSGEHRPFDIEIFERFKPD